MSGEDKKQSVEEHMKMLERRANVVRSRLLRAVDALDTRRHQVTEIGVQAKEAAPKVGLSLLGIAALSAGSFLGLRAYLKSRRQRMLSYRVQRFFGSSFPLRVEKKPSFAAEAFQRLAMTALTVLVTEATRRSLVNVFDGRFPDGRLAVGQALEAHREPTPPLPLNPQVNPQTIG
jgi:hypothetical protein